MKIHIFIAASMKGVIEEPCHIKFKEKEVRNFDNQSNLLEVISLV